MKASKNEKACYCLPLLLVIKFIIIIDSFMGLAHIVYYSIFLFESRDAFESSFLLYKFVIMILQPYGGNPDQCRQEFVNFMVLTVFQFMLYTTKGYYGVIAWRSQFKRKEFQQYYMVGFTTYLYMIIFSILVGATKFNFILLGFILIADIIQLLCHYIIRKYQLLLDTLKMQEDFSMAGCNIVETNDFNSGNNAGCSPMNQRITNRALSVFSSTLSEAKQYQSKQAIELEYG
eukprot:403347594